MQKKSLDALRQGFCPGSYVTRSSKAYVSNQAIWLHNEYCLNKKKYHSIGLIAWTWHGHIQRRIHKHSMCMVAIVVANITQFCAEQKDDEMVSGCAFLLLDSASISSKPNIIFVHVDSMYGRTALPESPALTPSINHLVWGLTISILCCTRVCTIPGSHLVRKMTMDQTGVWPNGHGLSPNYPIIMKQLEETGYDTNFALVDMTFSQVAIVWVQIWVLGQELCQSLPFHQKSIPNKRFWWLAAFRWIM